MSLRLDSYREAIRSALDNRPTIVGYLRSGAPVYAVCGFDGEADDSGTSDDDAGKDSDDENTDDEDDSSDKDDDEKDDPKGYKRRMQAADRRASELQSKLAALEAKEKERSDAELSELDKTKRDLADRDAEVADLKGQLARTRVENAFLAVNTVTWHDPEDALSKIDLDAIETDDNGKPNLKQLKAAIKDLASKKPYLVKQQEGDDSSSGASGSSMNGKRKGEQDKPDKDKLAERFPALGRT